MQRILILEDDRALNDGVALALRQEQREFIQAGTAAQAAELLAADEPDLVIMDLNLPDGDGLDFLRRLREHSAVPVLVITARDLETDQVTGLELGADDYVTKPFSLAVLRARVNSLLRRGAGRAEFAEGPFRFDFDTMSFRRGDESIELSRTEQRLLRLLVGNRGRVLPRALLLDRVWDGGGFVDENALSVAVRRLRAKLPGAPIKTVYGVGYTWEAAK